ncbi:MAG TPA: PAS domain S-box protein [Phycisphaerae bacterium]|nr:PAS domain S-box protein [Phycisphaerae bacterium]HRW53364.1 PAS domain S-box protein [Phycisphaerae bacterium]
MRASRAGSACLPLSLVALVCVGWFSPVARAGEMAFAERGSAIGTAGGDVSQGAMMAAVLASAPQTSEGAGAFSSLFDTSDFPPRWYCGRWSSRLGWTHIISDLAIFSAYFAIPLLLVIFVRKRPNFPFPRLLWLFAAFILTCGAVHFVEAVIFWEPIYRISAIIKVATAIVSWATVLALIPTMPRALALPGLAEVNKRLAVEVAARRKAESRMRTVIEELPNAMIMMDGGRRIRLVNRQTEALFGYTAAELIDEPIETLVPERFREGHPQQVDAYLSSPAPKVIGGGRDFFGRRRDGSEFPVEIGLNPIPGSDDGGTSVLAAVFDISERIRNEAELVRHARTLETKNEQLAQFTSFASHDLQEPLRKLVSFSELLVADAGDALPEAARVDLVYITDAAVRMKTLVGDLLTLSRSDSAELNRSDTPLDRCVDAALSMLDERIEESGAEIRRSPLPVVQCDETLITQLFQNLIGNALKYCSKDRPPIVNIHSASVDGVDTISVADNGIGIDPKYAKRVFEPFRRLHSRSAYEGSGIGLAICARIVDRHGGRIWVESRVGEGAVFHFTLG